MRLVVHTQNLVVFKPIPIVMKPNYPSKINPYDNHPDRMSESKSAHPFFIVS